MEKLVIRPVSSADPLALALIRRTFLEFEAPDYSQKGIQTFLSFLESSEQMEKVFMLGAYLGNQLTGVIAGNQEFSHVCLFFVDAPYQRRGIGRSLWQALLHRSAADRITVHSSPYAVEVYHRLGFRDLAEEELTDGMRYIPMEFSLNITQKPSAR